MPQRMSQRSFQLQLGLPCDIFFIQMEKIATSLERRELVVPRHLQVTDRLRELILGGSVAPGDVLPTIHQLAKQFDTSYFTVQSALTPLVEEGLIERRRRVGTIVKHNPAVLTCAGVYCGNGLLDEWAFAFCRELCRQIRQQLDEQHVQTLLYADMRSHNRQNVPLPELTDAIRTCRIQALFVPLCDGVSFPWLTRFPVATSFANSRQPPGRMCFDGGQMLRLVLGRLHDLGCKRIGVINSIRAPRDTHDESFRFCQAFVAAAAELGMETRDSWVITPTGDVGQHESCGYASFRNLWGQSERPDGLFVYPDTSARGAMTAALELGVRVPDDLKMVFHHNTGVDWVCPLAVDWVETDMARWAAEMIKEVLLQKAGKPVVPVVLEYEMRISDVG